VQPGASSDLSSAYGHVWDPVFPMGPAAPEGLPEHVFFLTADSNLDPAERHHYSSLGHATRIPNGLWQPSALPVLAPRSKNFDQAIWGAGVLSLATNRHILLYTGRSMSNPALPYIQRIGLATSTDPSMERWVQRNQPVLAPGAPYSTYNGNDTRGAGPIFRDPYPFVGPDGDIHVAFSARLAGRGTPYNACIGHAVATDESFTRWRLLPPLADGTGMYGEMEVPQVVLHNGRYYVFFTVHASHYNPSWTDVVGFASNGLHCFVANTLDGPSIPANGAGVVRNDEFNRGPRLFGKPDGDVYLAQGWRDGEGTSRGFVGGLSQMLRVTLEGYDVYAELVI
jgi:levansucrase